MRAMVIPTFMVIKRFSAILPLVGVCDAFVETFAVCGFFAKLETACGTVVTASTLRFRCLIPLLTDSVRTRTAYKSKMDVRQLLLWLQMLSSQQTAKLLPLFVTAYLHAENGTMLSFHFIPVVASFRHGVIQMFLACLNLHGYVAGFNLASTYWNWRQHRSIQIFAKEWSRTTGLPCADALGAVNNVKDMGYENEGIPPENIHQLFLSTQLEHGCVSTDYSFQQESTLHLVPRHCYRGVSFDETRSNHRETSARVAAMPDRDSRALCDYNSF